MSSMRRSKKKKEKLKAASKTGPEEKAKPLPIDAEPLPTEGRAIKLAEFVHNFGHYLPLRVKVEEGYCGTEER